jgi:hypothetical protein
MTRQEILSTIRCPEAIALISLPGVPIVVGAIACGIGLKFDNPTLTRLGLGLMGVGATPESVVIYNVLNPEKPRPVPPQIKP